MPALYTTIGPLTLQTFTLALAVSILASAGLALRRLESRGRAADALLGALAGGVVGARLFHVLLNWDYFAENLNEAFSLLAGGLDWHGAVIGGLVGLWGALWVSRRTPSGRQMLKHLAIAESPLKRTEDQPGQRIPVAFRRLFSNSRQALAYGGSQARSDLSRKSDSPTFSGLLDALAPALPLLALGGWYGCLAAGCGYGREVDTLANYPPLIAAELVDVYGLVAPRFNTPLFGMALAVVGLLLVGLMIWRGWLQGRRFWTLLAFLSAGMFIMGFFRADHTAMIAGVRGDQWLDVGLFALSFQRSAISFQQKQRIAA